jgi:hypothetical protein
MNSKPYYGYIYLIILPYNSISKFPECHPFYFGQRKGEFDPYYYGSGTIIEDWFTSKIRQSSRSIRPTLANKLSIERYIIAYAKSQEELNLLEKFFVDPNINTHGCINLRSGGNSGAYSDSALNKLVERNKSPEFRKKISVGQKRAWRSLDRKQKLNDWQREYWSNPENHTKHSILAKETKNVDTSETRKKISQGNKRWWKEHKAKHWYNPRTGETYLREICPDGCIPGMAKRGLSYDGWYSPDFF